MALRDYRRLWHAARVLARNDALFPKEYEDLLPPSARLARRLLGSGRAKHDSAPPGVRSARALESLGPAYIKLGQVLATRPDIVGDDVAPHWRSCRIVCRRSRWLRRAR